MAIIAVHGVARHEPGETARAMASLLQTLPNPLTPDDAGRYHEFTAEPILIPLRPVQTGPDAPRPRMRALMKVLNVMSEPSKRFAAKLEQPDEAEGAKAADPVAVANQYMRALLQDYKGSGANTFSTERLIGKRTAKGGKTSVHIYEAYWADLARPNNSILSFVAALFQVLLHIGELATLSLDSGAGENNTARWRLLRRLQTYAVRMLQIPIPVLNVILLLGVLPILLVNVTGSIKDIAAVGIAGLLGIAVGYRLAPQAVRSRTPLAWLAWPAVSAAAGLCGGKLLLHFCPTGARTILLVEWWLVGAVAFSLIVQTYDSIRPGTLQIGRLLYAFAFCLFMLLYYIAIVTYVDAAYSKPVPGQPPFFLGIATLWFMEWMLAILRLCWGALFVFAFLAFLVGLSTWQESKGAPGKARARAAIWTSTLGLTMPSVLLYLLMIFFWGGVFRWSIDPDGLNLRLFDYVAPSLAPSPQWLHWLFIDPGSADRLLQPLDVDGGIAQTNRYFLGAVIWSAGPGLVITCAALGATLIIMLLGILPSAATERYPLKDEMVPPRSGNNRISERMGQWLTRLLDSTRFVVPFLWTGFFVVIGAFDCWWYLAEPGNRLLQTLTAATYSLVIAIGGLTASLAVLGLIIRYSSSALGIILDVDTYLRATPVNATPRAKIVERYVSLLRYVAKHKDEQGRGYDSVVIVAHSLGSLISADLLLFLNASRCDNELAALGLGPKKQQASIPIFLFTMGSPLRQLLNRFFPYLYGWVRQQPDGSLTPSVESDGSRPEITPGSGPSPSLLGVKRWVNAYRSGDYVGRYLWLNGWYQRNQNGPERGSASEMPYIAALELVQANQ